MQTTRSVITWEDQPDSCCIAVMDRWIDFNRKLNRDARALINEAVIQDRLDEVRQMETDDSRVLWLTVARIAEMAIIQAGIYADSCEFQAAGDLLVNPRRIDVYRRGWPNPVVKDRHRALSEQFASAIGTENPVAWLCRETITTIREAPLIPTLKQMLVASEMIDSRHLNFLVDRIRRVADTIAFLNAWRIDDCGELFRRIETGSPADRKMVNENLCGFGFDCFDAMGEDIEKIRSGNEDRSRFLRTLPAE